MSFYKQGFHINGFHISGVDHFIPALEEGNNMELIKDLSGSTFSVEFNIWDSATMDHATGLATSLTNTTVKLWYQRTSVGVTQAANALSSVVEMANGTYLATFSTTNIVSRIAATPIVIKIIDTETVKRWFDKELKIRHGKLETTEDTVASTAGAVASVSSAVSTVDGKVVAVDGKVDTVSGKVDTVDGKVVTVSGKVDTVDGKVVTVSGKVDTVDGKVVTVSGKVDTVNSAVSTVDGKVVTVEGKVDATKTVVDDTAAKTTVVHGLMATSSPESTSIGEVDAPLPTKIDVLYQSLVNGAVAVKSPTSKRQILRRNGTKLAEAAINDDGNTLSVGTYQ